MQSCKGCRILAQDRGEFLFVGGEVEGLLVREDDEARFAAGWLLDVADFRVIDGDLRGAAGFAEMGGEAGGEQDIFLAGLDALILQDDMGAGDVLRMEPGIVEACRVEGQLVVLIIVLADEDGGAIRCAEVEGASRLVVVLLLGLLAQVAGGDEFIVDLGDLSEARRGEQRSLDALEVGDVVLAFAALHAQEFLRTLELVVFLVAGLHILHERQPLVERDFYGLARLAVDVWHFDLGIFAVLELVLIRHEVVAAHLEVLGVFGFIDFLVELYELVLGAVLLVLDELAEAVFVRQHVGA